MNTNRTSIFTAITATYYNHSATAGHTIVVASFVNGGNCPEAVRFCSHESKFRVAKMVRHVFGDIEIIGE